MHPSGTVPHIRVPHMAELGLQPQTFVVRAPQVWPAGQLLGQVPPQPFGPPHFPEQLGVQQTFAVAPPQT